MHGWHIDAACCRRQERRYAQGLSRPKDDIYDRLADSPRTNWEIFELMGTILLIVVVLLLIGALPHWPYSSGWGYYPSGGLGLVLLIIVILLVLRYI
jgi:hypothetical protein